MRRSLGESFECFLDLLSMPSRPCSCEASTGDEVLEATQRGLEVDLRQLRGRLRDAEVAVSREEEKAVACEEQKDEAKECFGLLRKLQAGLGKLVRGAFFEGSEEVWDAVHLASLRPLNTDLKTCGELAGVAAELGGAGPR